jgi:hypothetical protein
MRKMQSVLPALALAIVASLAGGGPARADYDYPWCAQGGEYDYPGECAYQTYQQCLASVSGRLLYCGPNPRVAYGLRQQPPLQPPPKTRSRRAPPN